MKLKHIAILALTLVLQLPLEILACEVCQKNQPKILQNITHGTGPQSDLDYILIWTAIGVVIVSLAISIKLIIQPKDNRHEQIKNIVID